MNYKYILYFFILITVRLSRQSENDIDDNSLSIYSEPSELNNLILRISSYVSSVERATNFLEDKLINVAKVVQRNVDIYLEKFANSVSHLFDENIENDSFYYTPTTTTTIAPAENSRITFKDIARMFATKIRDLKNKIHNKIDQIISGVKYASNAFKNFVSRHANDFRCKVDLLRISYPGIESEDCSEMLRNFKTALITIFESTINCVKDAIIAGTAAVDNVDDLALEDIKTNVNDMKTAWNCVVQTEGNYAYKFIRCVNFGSVKGAYTLVKSLVTKMDDNFDEFVDKAEKSLKFTTCIGRRVRDSYEHEILTLVQSVTICSANVNTMKPDLSTCQLPKEITNDL